MARKYGVWWRHVHHLWQPGTVGMPEDCRWNAAADLDPSEGPSYLLKRAREVMIADLRTTHQLIDGTRLVSNNKSDLGLAVAKALAAKATTRKSVVWLGVEHRLFPADVYPNDEGDT